MSKLAIAVCCIGLLPVLVSLTACEGTIRRITDDHAEILPAQIVALSHDSVVTNEQVTFSVILAKHHGASNNKFTYFWDFGALARPRFSTAATPSVTIRDDAEDSTIKLTVYTGIENLIELPDDIGDTTLFVPPPNTEFPSDSADFPIDVIPQESTDATVLNVSTVSGGSGEMATFTADVYINPDATGVKYLWTFGAGAAKQTLEQDVPVGTSGNVQVSATVELAIPKTELYKGSLAVTKDGDERTQIATRDFDYRVHDIQITGVSPVTGQAGSEIDFSTTVVRGKPTKFVWELGSGVTAPATRETTEPSITATLAASPASMVPAKLIASNAYTSKEVSFTYSTFAPGAPPEAYFSEVPTVIGQVGDMVDFSATVVTELDNLRYEWDFRDLAKGPGTDPQIIETQMPQVSGVEFVLDNEVPYKGKLTVYKIGGAGQRTAIAMTDLFYVVNP